MAEYVLIPQRTGPATKEELERLLDHIEHDFLNKFIGLFSLQQVVRENLESSGDLDQAKQLLKMMTPETSVVYYINSAMHYLKKSKPIGIRSNLIEYFDFFKSEEESATNHAIFNPPIIKTKFPPELMTTNNCNVIFMQTYNFYQNSKRYPEIVIGAELVSLCEKELTYLGQNQFRPGSPRRIYTTDDLFVRTYVSDLGPGIPEKDLPKIFTGRIIDGQRKKEGGVGLSLVELVCDYLHGFVKVESEVGKGSTFSLYFPQEYKQRRVPKQLELPFPAHS